ncbi:hypothetical protein DFH06DRAFT_1480024, partial [Mycena polygramma]
DSTLITLLAFAPELSRGLLRRPLRSFSLYLSAFAFAFAFGHLGVRLTAVRDSFSRLRGFNSVWLGPTKPLKSAPRLTSASSPLFKFNQQPRQSRGAFKTSPNPS